MVTKVMISGGPAAGSATRIRVLSAMGILQPLSHSCALGRGTKERVTIEPTQTATDTNNDAVRHGRLEPLRSVIERTRVLWPVPRKDCYGRQGPAEMTVEDGRPQINEVRKDASNETSCEQNAELGFRQSDRNSEQNDAKDNIHTRRNRIRMRHLIHDSVLQCSRNKADHSY
jgi:hypothetical protein